MDTESNIRTLRPFPSPSPQPCAMCGARVDVVLCSFAFERVHRRIPLCRAHRQPLIEMDHFTRAGTAPTSDVPAAWTQGVPQARLARLGQATARRRVLAARTRGPLTGTVIALPLRRDASAHA